MVDETSGETQEIENYEGFNIVRDSQHRIVQFEILSDSVSTYRGITVGNSREDVLAAYPELEIFPQEQKLTSLFYDDEEYLMEFCFLNDPNVVSNIEIRDATRIADNIRLIASIPEEKVYLYPCEYGTSAYKGFVLESKGQRKYFDWTAIADWEIQLACLDINKDDRDEIVVILYKGGGTDVAQYEIHILDRETFAEIPVENPLDYIRREVHTSITKTSAELLINIKIGDKEYLCKRALPGFCAIDSIVFGNIIRFELENQSICCSVPGMYCIPGYVGDFRVYYKYDAATNEMKAAKVVFKDYGSPARP